MAGVGLLTMAHQCMCHSNVPRATRMFDLNSAVTEWQIEVDCHPWGLKQQLGCEVEALEGCEGISLAVAVVEEGQSRTTMRRKRQS